MGKIVTFLLLQRVFLVFVTFIWPSLTPVVCQYLGDDTISVAVIIDQYYRAIPKQSYEFGKLMMDRQTPVILRRDNTCPLLALASLSDILKNASSSQLLPRYRIELKPYWHLNYLPAATRLIDEHLYSRRWDNETNTTPSPLNIGPYSGDCTYGTSDYLTAVTLHQKLLREMAMKHFQANQLYHYCNNLEFVSSKALFTRPIDDVDGPSVAIFHVISKLFGWKEIAVVSLSKNEFSRNALAWLSGKNTVRVLTLAREVILRGYFLTFKSNLYAAVKAEPRARIVVVYRDLQLPTSPDGFFDSYFWYLCLEMWCTSYAAGIRAPKYILLTNLAECAIIPEGIGLLFRYGNCTFDTVDKQARITFVIEEEEWQWRLPTVGAEAARRIRSIFSREDEEKQRKMFISNGCSSEWASWQSINEVVLSMAVVLNRTEEILSLNGENVRLRDYRRTPLATDKINKAVIQAATEFEFRGTKPERVRQYYGTFWLHQVHLINISAEFTASEGRVKKVTIAKLQYPGIDWPLDGSIVEPNITILQEPQWQTASGRKPKDLSHILQVNGNFSLPAASLVISIAFVISLIEVLFQVYAKFRHLLLVKCYFDFRSHSFLILGCLILNISASVTSAGTTFIRLKYLCFWRPLFLVIGLALIDGTLYARMLIMPLYIKDHKYITRKARKPNLFNLEYFDQDRKKRRDAYFETLKKILATIIGSAVVLLLLWFPSDHMKDESKIYYEDAPLFDDASDSFYVVHVEWCDSSSYVYWAGFFTALHFVSLLYCSLQFVALRKTRKFLRRTYANEYRLMRSLVANSLTISLFAILLLFALPSQPDLSFLKPTAFAACQLLFSGTTAVIVFSPFWSSWLVDKCSKNSNDGNLVALSHAI